MGQKTYRWDRYGVMVMGVVLGADTHARSQRKFLQPENGDETFTCTTARRNSLGETHIAQRKLNRTGGAAENEDAVDTITAGFDFAV